MVRCGAEVPSVISVIPARKWSRDETKAARLDARIPFLFSYPTTHAPSTCMLARKKNAPWS